MDTQSLKLEWLRAFARFAETRNFTHTASALNISQPALHTQIRRLSETVGTPLYTRHGRALRLTPAGEDVAASARDILGEVERLATRIEAGPEQPVVVAAGRGTHLYLISDYTQRWVSAGGSLELKTLGAEATIEAVRAARADVGVAPLTGATNDLMFETVATVELVAVMSRDHPLANRRRITLKDLRNEDLILPPRGGPLRATDPFLAEANVRVEAVGWDILLHYARMRMGITIVNDYVPPPPDLVAVPIQGLPATAFSVFRRAEGMLGEDARAFYDGLANAMKR